MDEGRGPGTGEMREGRAERRVSVLLSPDGLGAVIALGADARRVPVMKAELLEELKSAGVVFGLIDEGLVRLVRERPLGEKVLVAKGLPPVPARDGRVEYFFDIESMGRPRIDEQGGADFKDINLIFNVKPGDGLARIHPPAPGAEGKAVTGLSIKPAPGKPAQLLPGANAAVSKDDPSLIVATAGGAVAVREGRISVEPVMEIRGSVDYATGNIDFNGALTVRGDVKPGFSVKTAGNLVVQGVVEDAALSSGGDVNVQMGVVGTGKASVEAEGSIFVRFAERSKLTARRDVVAGEYLLGCAVRAGNEVRAVDKTGVILGGEVAAAIAVAARTVGNEQGVDTRIAVGYSDEALARLREIDERARRAAENRKKVMKGFEILKRIKLLKRELPEEKKELLRKLADVSGKLKAVIEETAAQRGALAEELRGMEGMQVTVLDTIYPGASLNFRELVYRPEARERNVVYRLVHGGIKKTFTV